MHPEDKYYPPSKRSEPYPPNHYTTSDPVIGLETAERWLRRIAYTGYFVMGIFIGAAIKWWLS